MMGPGHNEAHSQDEETQPELQLTQGYSESFHTASADTYTTVMYLLRSDLIVVQV